MAVPMQKRFVTLDEYQQMAEDGVFPPEARLELIRGEMVEMSPIGDRHAWCVVWLCDLLVDLRPEGILSPQNPLKLPQLESAPQPDAVVFRRIAFKARRQSAKDVLLVVEVADSSLAYDRDVKMRLYAQAEIPEFWLVDLNSQRIFVYRQPSSEGYQEVRAYYRGESISLQAFPEKQFGVGDILGA